MCNDRVAFAIDLLVFHLTATVNMLELELLLLLLPLLLRPLLVATEVVKGTFSITFSAPLDTFH